MSRLRSQRIYVFDEGFAHLDADDAAHGHVGDHVLLSHLVPVRLPGGGVVLHLDQSELSIDIIHQSQFTCHSAPEQ